MARVDVEDLKLGSRLLDDLGGGFEGCPGREA